MTGLNEADVEAAAVGWLAGLGWNVAHGTEVNPDAAPAERTDYSAVALAATLREALARLNPELPGETLSNAVRRLTHPEGATLEARNRAFHRMVVDGVTVEYRDDGRIRGAQARVIDFDDPANNDWLAVNQFTVVENTGSASDPLKWQPHIRNKPRREALANRFRDPDDPLRVVLVRDMWLTGFDAPSLHTMYVDKPMRGHGLMQAIARVNRVFRDKPGGLVVDYLGLAHELKKALSKPAPGESRLEEDLDHAVRQIISRAVTPQGVLDIFAAAGLDKPDISVLSEEFLAEVRGLPQRNLAVEALRRLLQGEVNRRRVRNVVQARSFSEMLAQSILRYQNRAIEAAQVIEELIGLAQEIREADARGERLGLSEEELAFYDALETNDSAVKVLGDETLRAIACELVETVRNNVTIDWTMRENVRAKLRTMVRRILRRHGYPPDKQEKATKTVLEQAEALSAAWATAA